MAESSGTGAASGTGETAREATSTSTTTAEEPEIEIIHLTGAESQETDAGGDTDADPSRRFYFKSLLNKPAVLFLYDFLKSHF